MWSDPWLLQRGCTLRCEQRDFPEWHRGRPHYLCWVIDVDRPAVRRRWQQARTALQELLLPDYVRQPHVTLALGGFPQLQAGPEALDAAGLLQQLQGLRQAAIAPFALQLGRLDSFASVPYLQVHAAAPGYAGARRALLAAEALAEPHVPHLTLGHYADAWPLERLAACRERVPDLPLTLPVQQLWLVAYATHDIGGRLWPVAEWDLQQQRLRWHDSRLLGPIGDEVLAASGVQSPAMPSTTS